MKILSVSELAIPEVKVIRFARFLDHRGYFTESYRKSDLQVESVPASLRGLRFVQTNESFSRAGTVRGLHFQWNPYMGKLIRTVAGHLIDLALDIRKGSPTFGRIIAHDMPSTGEQAHGEWIWVPPGFAHGVFFLQDTYIEYFCTGEYSPGCEAGISPLAKDIDWSLCDLHLKRQFDTLMSGNKLISEKDQNAFTIAAWADDKRSDNFIFPMRALAA
ncbi:MAG TPA: dTDP-4-dehydrorhamnose 3,5-epimerase family protein [Gemmataceae bacterium]|jgi:dTDP-4-dehydrorhamnose 3,5-epimerase